MNAPSPRLNDIVATPPASAVTSPLLETEAVDGVRLDQRPMLVTSFVGLFCTKAVPLHCAVCPMAMVAGAQEAAMELTLPPERVGGVTPFWIDACPKPSAENRLTNARSRLVKFTETPSENGECRSRRCPRLNGESVGGHGSFNRAPQVRIVGSCRRGRVAAGQDRHRAGSGRSIPRGLERRGVRPIAVVDDGCSRLEGGVDGDADAEHHPGGSHARLPSDLAVVTPLVSLSREGWKRQPGCRSRVRCGEVGSVLREPVTVPVKAKAVRAA